MNSIINSGGTYQTLPQSVSWLARMAPSLMFYRRFIHIVWRASILAKRGLYDSAAWSDSSLKVLQALERVGVRMEITGVEHLKHLDTPCVIIGNHMSLLETVVLPAIVQPVRDVTFIVKESLLHYPVFKHVMRARDPIAVVRENPRLDFKAVMEGGRDRLERGISIIVFPQTSRTVEFHSNALNTIGVKLAQRVGVPIVPLALQTDTWANGKRFKDLGKIDPSKRVHFAFSKPLTIQGHGLEEHQATVDFISGRLKQWKQERSGG